MTHCYDRKATVDIRQNGDENVDDVIATSSSPGKQLILSS